MLTRMTDEDWEIVVQVFRAVRSRRGDKGRDDRTFLEALHYFAVHNITWRALPAAFGNWNSIWKRFWRLSQAGVFEAFFDALAATSRTAHLVQMLDSTVVRAHVSAAGAKGGQDGQALGRSRGGFSTKIHLKADLDGLPLAFHLTEGQASDSPQFEILLDLGPDITPRAAVGDKGYDSTGSRGAATWHLPGDPVQAIGRDPAGLLSASPLPGSRPHRAACGQAQALQEYRSVARKRSKTTDSSPHHRQIRPHGRARTQ